MNVSSQFPALIGPQALSLSDRLSKAKPKPKKKKSKPKPRRDGWNDA